MNHKSRKLYLINVAMGLFKLKLKIDYLFKSISFYQCLCKYIWKIILFLVPTSIHLKDGIKKNIKKYIISYKYKEYKKINLFS